MSATSYHLYCFEQGGPGRLLKRPDTAVHVTLGSELIGSLAQEAEEVLDIHAALEELARVDARLAQVVQMRYFAGMTDAEIGEALSLTDRTVRRDWEKARLILAHLLQR